VPRVSSLPCPLPRRAAGLTERSCCACEAAGCCRGLGTLGGVLDRGRPLLAELALVLVLGDALVALGGGVLPAAFKLAKSCRA
jgi:hypothetical protein